MVLGMDHAMGALRQWIRLVSHEQEQANDFGTNWGSVCCTGPSKTKPMVEMIFTVTTVDIWNKKTGLTAEVMAFWALWKNKWKEIEAQIWSIILNDSILWFEIWFNDCQTIKREKRDKNLQVWHVWHAQREFEHC